MSSELSEAHIVGLFVAKHVSLNKDAQTLDFAGVSNVIRTDGNFPFEAQFYTCMGIFGYGKHKFKIQALDPDGEPQFEEREKENDFGNGSMYWEVPLSTFQSDGPSVFELVVYLDGKVAAAIPIKVLGPG